MQWQAGRDTDAGYENDDLCTNFCRDSEQVRSPRLPSEVSTYLSDRYPVTTMLQAALVCHAVENDYSQQTFEIYNNNGLFSILTRQTVSYGMP